MYSRCQIDPISHASTFCAMHRSTVRRRPGTWQRPSSFSRAELGGNAPGCAALQQACQVDCRATSSSSNQNTVDICISCLVLATKWAAWSLLHTSTLAVPPKATKSIPASESAGCGPLYTLVDSTSPVLR